MTEAASAAIGLSCMRCGEGHHITACPEVKAVEFHESGDLRRVEFLTPADMLRDGDATVDPVGQPYQTLQPGWKNRR